MRTDSVISALRLAQERNRQIQAVLRRHIAAAPGIFGDTLELLAMKAANRTDCSVEHAQLCRMFQGVS